MGFYIEELPTEFNGITMQEADALADEFLTEAPCNETWDAVRALRDFYETVTNDAVEIIDRLNALKSTLEDEQQIFICPIQNDYEALIEYEPQAGRSE